MPEIIECPSCQRKLRLEESVIGQTVQCPSRQHAFTASAPDRPPAPRRADDDMPTYRPIDDEPPPRPAVNRRPRRRYDEDDDEDYPRSRRPRFVEDYRKPHRGTAVLVLGIISLVLFFSLPGLIMAIVSVVMGSTDLAAMNRGDMDERGRGQTKGGLICGIIALCLEALVVFSCCGLAMLDKLYFAYNNSMGYRNLRACVADLERAGQLVRIDAEVDPYLEIAEIQRRVYQAQGPALLFTRVKGCAFPLLGNLFGTLQRARFLFRDTLDAVRQLVELKIDPGAFWKQPWRYRTAPRTLWHLRPRCVRSGPILSQQTTIGCLPQLQCWPKDGGAFVTLPLVYTEDADQPGWRHSNLGMYRVQLSGNQYQPDAEVGLHYQIHRGIGVHHAKALQRGVPFRVNIFVGGPPALMLAAVMPLPEGLPELAFAGALGGRRLDLVQAPLAGGKYLSLPIPAAADFCIIGTVDPDRLLPEGPFGDHLGYYSLAHDFPVLNVEAVYHRPDAIWPFTVVGRPPQEDTSFGALIHELTGPIIPTVVPGVHAVHAVDAAGVHPLLLAIGSERYVPYERERRPQELLTCANALLGQGQLSLAKYLLIAAQEDDPALDIHDIPAFFRHLLERVDWTTDLHFQTCTTIDTLDYSGSGLNAGSKVVIAAAGPRRRTLPQQVPADLRLPDGYGEPRLCMPGFLAVQAPPFLKAKAQDFCDAFTERDTLNSFPLVLLVDDSEFTAATLNNWLWVTFTRSNPAADIHGIGAFTEQKHWGCTGALVIDARIKPHHAPPLVEDAAVSRRVEALAVPGGPLYRLI